MNTIASSVCWRVICSIAIITLATCAPIGRSNSLSLPPTMEPIEPPKCLDDLEIHLTSNPSTIVYGESSVVSWSVDLPPNCVQISVRLNGRPVAKSGRQTVMPSHDTKYTVRVFFSLKGVPGEMAPSSTQITVTYPAVVVIDDNTTDPVGALVGALQSTTNQKVQLCNVDIDLTGYTNIVLGDNRSLIASPECERGPHSLGPRIFVTDERGSEPLFLIHGDNVTISGFRLEGPTRDIGSGDDNKEFGIKIRPFDRETPVEGIEISNMEISYWSGVGVYVTDTQAENERGRLFKMSVDAIHLKNNYFHHNRHDSGEGYGVEITGGAYALIERNVFDLNRHAIAGGSRPKDKDNYDYSGYTARNNLILSGGGRHCLEGSGKGALAGGLVGGLVGGIVGGLLGGPIGAGIGAAIGVGIGAGVGGGVIPICWQTHQIDMHGDQNIWPTQHNWQCGIAGETIIIERNTILYNKGTAIKIRGNPKDKAIVDSNVFAQEENDAIYQSGDCGWFDTSVANPIEILPNNVFDFDAYGHYGVCDFDGDGIDDLFLATGNMWWYSSYGEFHWTYLSERSERLNQVRLGYFDDDLLCDVLMESNGEWVISSGGTGEWRSIGQFGAPLSEVAFGQFDSSGPNPTISGTSGVPSRTTHAFWRTQNCDTSCDWLVTPLSDPDWQLVGSSSFPMSDLRFGDFTGDGVTDVLAVEGGRWAISESARGAWQELNPDLDDDVDSLYIADLDNNNIDDLIKLESTQYRMIGNIVVETFTWWVSDDGRSHWRKLRPEPYKFTRSANISVPPIFAFAGRFGAAPGGGVLLIDHDRIGHFFSEAEKDTGALPDWLSLFPY
jgi:hypothetical protein